PNLEVDNFYTHLFNLVTRDNVDIQTKAYSILEKILINSNGKNEQFWKEQIFPILIKNISTESTNLIQPTLSLLSVYYKFFTFQLDDILLSVYFNESMFCSK